MFYWALRGEKNSKEKKTNKFVQLRELRNHASTSPSHIQTSFLSIEKKKQKAKIVLKKI